MTNTDHFVNEVCDALRQDSGFMTSGMVKLKQHDLSTEIPPKITNAAKLVSEWFEMQGVNDWALMLMGLQPRKPEPLGISPITSQIGGLNATTYPDIECATYLIKEKPCQICDGRGWNPSGEVDNAAQLQCQFCGGTGNFKPEPEQLMREMAKDASEAVSERIEGKREQVQESPLVSLLEMIQSEADACQRISTDCPSNVVPYYRERAVQYQLWATALREQIGDEP